MNIHGLMNKVRQVLTDPVNFFENLKQEVGIKSVFKYLVVLSLFNTILTLIFSQYSYGFFQKIFGIPISAPQFSIPTLIPFTSLSGLVTLFLIAGIIHIWILIMGGKSTYTKTYQMYVYSHTPTLVMGWIPLLGLLAPIYSLLLLVVGTYKVYSISRVKAILMYVIPYSLFYLWTFGMMFFSFAMLKAYPNILQKITPVPQP